MLKLSSGGKKISLANKPINLDNAVVDGTPSEDHSLRISMENLKVRDDHDNHNRDQMDDVGFSQNLKPETRSNNGHVLPQNKLMEVLEKEVFAHHNKEAEVDRLLNGKKIVRWQRREDNIG